jgi:hypothetical protein
VYKKAVPCFAKFTGYKTNCYLARLIKGGDIMSNKHPHYKPAISNKVWGEIVRDVDEYYDKHKKHRKSKSKLDINLQSIQRV